MIQELNSSVKVARHILGCGKVFLISVSGAIRKDGVGPRNPEQSPVGTTEMRLRSYINCYMKNVFEDLGFSPEEAAALRLKADLHSKVVKRAAGYSQKQLQAILGEPNRGLVISCGARCRSSAWRCW